VENLVANTAYVASRAKSRRKKLADLPRMRQLINQSTDQLTSSVSNMGYSDEVNLYAGKLTGADLVEAALTHNLESELDDILSMCNGKIRSVIEIYTSRFEYQNAKVVLRSVVNDVSLEKVSNSILPDLNEVNTPWLKIIENSDDLRSAVLQMRRKSFGSELKSLPEDSRLSDYEDALDRHYYKSAIKTLKANNPATRYLRDYL
jgi:vacuolar-type H+-ATPase subunit C/Vma6